MTETGEMLDLIFDFIEDDTVEEEALDYLNFSLKKMEKHKWSQLRGTIMVEVSSGVLQIPPRCQQVLTVNSAITNGGPSIEFNPIDVMPSSEKLRRNCHWVMPMGAREVTSATINAVIAQGSRTFSTNDDVSAILGELQRAPFAVAGGRQEYEIMNAYNSEEGLTDFVFAPEFCSDLDGELTVNVYPAGRDQLMLLRPDLTPFEGSVMITYQKSHPRLWSRASNLIIPCVQSITFLAIQMFQQTNKYDVDAERLNRRLLDAMNEEISGTLFSETHQPTGSRMFAVRSNRR